MWADSITQENRKKFLKPIKEFIKKTSTVIISLTQSQLPVVFRGPKSRMNGYLYLYIFILSYQFLPKFIFF